MKSGFAEKVKFYPTEGKYKVYIIDEVHMLTRGPLMLLLKTLEEPPSNVVFILATTETHKVIDTILSFASVLILPSYLPGILSNAWNISARRRRLIMTRKP